MSQFRASYTHSIDRGVVCIVDQNVGKSVTNDADNIIAELFKAGVVPAAGPVVYRDTEGRWDQLEVVGGKFAGFKSLSEPTQAAAVAKVLGMVPKQYGRHRSGEEVIALAKAQGFKIDGSKYEAGGDHVVVHLPGPSGEPVMVLFNVFSGRFFHAPEGDGGFSSDEKLDGLPWFDAMLEFFYTEAIPA